MKKNLAFTLAETLIVMGIIGVVAALTLPNLNSSSGDRERVAKVKKIYQNLTDAYGRATAVYGPFDEWFQNDSTDAVASKRFATRMTEFMKVSKDCEFDTSGKCFTTKDKKFNESSYSENGYAVYNSNNIYKVILADGTALAFHTAINHKIYHIYVDLDGPSKGVSSWGLDLFMFFVSKDESVYGNKDPNNPSEMPCSLGFDCSAWIIENGNADYLKTTDGKTCPNGTVLSKGGNKSCK